MRSLSPGDGCVRQFYEHVHSNVVAVLKVDSRSAVFFFSFSSASLHAEDAAAGVCGGGIMIDGVEEWRDEKRTWGAGVLAFT